MVSTIQHFGFRENPFNRAPDPRYHFADGELAESYERLVRSLRNQDGLFVLTGEHGTGKSMLLRRLEHDLKPATICFPVYFSSISYQELLRTLSDRLQVPMEEAEPDLLPQRLHAATLQLAPEADSAALLIDDAQNLDQSVVENLLNLAGNDNSLFKIVLAGLPELERLMEPGGAAGVGHHMAAHTRLRNVDRTTTTSLIQHRLQTAGASNSLIPDTTIDRIYVHSGGNPGRIVSLCDHALFETAQRDAQVITPAIVETVVQERSLEERRAVLEAEKDAPSPQPVQQEPEVQEAPVDPVEKIKRKPKPPHLRPDRARPSGPQANTSKTRQKSGFGKVLVAAIGGAAIMFIAMEFISPVTNLTGGSGVNLPIAPPTTVDGSASLNRTPSDAENIVLLEEIAAVRNSEARLRGEYAALLTQKDWLARKLAKLEAQAILIQSALQSVETDGATPGADQEEKSSAQAVADVIRERNILRQSLARLELEAATQRTTSATRTSSENDEAFMRQLSTENDQLRTQIGGLEGSIYDLEIQLSEALTVREELTAEISNLKNSLSSATEQANLQQTDIRAALENALSQANELTTQVAFLQGQIAELEKAAENTARDNAAALQTLTGERDAIVVRLAEAETDRNTIADRLAEIEAENDAVSTRLAESEASRIASEAAAQDAIQSAEQAANRSNDAPIEVSEDADRQDMIGRIVTLTRERNSLRDSLATAELQIETLTAEVEELREAAFTRRRR